ncbi:MAG: hypothetical protein CTY15_09220 [Methylocystis sp.]|nr:MAG: hypothetical protein CTY15_09220 [Methylocystis sp.]
MHGKPGFTTLFSDAFTMSVAANAVIAVRLTKMAFGVVDPHHESGLMVAEKLDAATEATMAATVAIFSGEAHHAAGCAVAVYKRRVDRNLRRLTSG